MVCANLTRGTLAANAARRMNLFLKPYMILDGNYSPMGGRHGASVKNRAESGSFHRQS